METDRSILDGSQEPVAKAAKKNSKTTAVEDEKHFSSGQGSISHSKCQRRQFKNYWAWLVWGCWWFVHWFQQCVCPPVCVCTPTKRTKLSRRRESDGEPHTPPNHRMILVHEADPVPDIVTSDGSWGEILLSKHGLGLEVINQIHSLAVGITITPNTKWKDLLSPSPGKPPFVCDTFPFYQRSLKDAFPQSEFFSHNRCKWYCKFPILSHWFRINEMSHFELIWRNCWGIVST